MNKCESLSTLQFSHHRALGTDKRGSKFHKDIFCVHDASKKKKEFSSENAIYLAITVLNYVIVSWLL